LLIQNLVLQQQPNPTHQIPWVGPPTKVEFGQKRVKEAIWGEILKKAGEGAHDYKGKHGGISEKG